MSPTCAQISIFDVKTGEVAKRARTLVETTDSDVKVADIISMDFDSDAKLLVCQVRH